MRITNTHHIFQSFLFFLLVSLPIFGQAQDELPMLRFNGGKLVYTPDSLGNRIPDFSFCGYESSNADIPLVPIVAVVDPMDGDAAATIQSAIDFVGKLPQQSTGFRGAVLIRKGHYRLEGRLSIRQSGIVLRGEGPETILEATGIDRETLIRIEGNNDQQLQARVAITNAFVPVGAQRLAVQDASTFRVGDAVTVQRPAPQEWIDQLGVNEFGGGTGWLKWKPGERNIAWERTIKRVEGHELELDAPITTALDTAWGGATISKLEWPGRIAYIGIENLDVRSAYNKDNPKDEDHCWNAISFENTQNAWVRKVNFKHFAGSAVAVYETGSQITVQDCVSTEPVSEIAGERRNTFFTMGQRTLFLRCYAANGRHDFAAGFCAAGPNAFVQCTNYLPFDFSGSIDSWASGLLFDNVRVDGQAIRFTNLERTRQGAGWNAANSMLWQTSAAKIDCYSPPTAFNWAYGVWARFAGNGLWYEANSHINPVSLFFAQLATRKGQDIRAYDDQLLHYEGASTSKPSHEQAAEASVYAEAPAPNLLSLIQHQTFPEVTQKEQLEVKVIQPLRAASDPPESGTAILEKGSLAQLKNGLILYRNELVTGRQTNVPWWRGDDRPFYTEKSQPALTRFVPGRHGLGYTDRIEEVLADMKAENIAVLHHNYGLWYDRRRDDHERVRRMDGDTWAPFYEQPFARSGQGEAWDRLSKYDLTRFNGWYWNRLSAFAEAAEPEGKFLIHEHYFQHNILEAGAHWADSPWRPANNINDTGFPEPPNYAGDKRIFFADQFYDTDHPVRRKLHRRYIRQCLDALKNNSNVLQSISEEFTGPLQFVQFWLEVIEEWKTENKTQNLISLSATKDVQDAILQDPKYAPLVDVIDIRYWAFRADSSLYAPKGGISLAPRQNARLESPGKRSFQSVYRSVSEYRTAYPEKAVIYSENRDVRWGWAILMAGGSLPPIPADLPRDFYEWVGHMQPVATAENAGYYTLRNDDGEYLIYLEPGATVNTSLNIKNYYIDQYQPDGQLIQRERRKIKRPFVFRNETGKPLILCVHQKAWYDEP